MKKTKVASMANPAYPATPANSMAPAELPKPKLSPEDKVREGGYDLDHLLKAEDIKNDPDRMANVMAAHQKRTTGMRSIADLKTAAQALAHDQKQASMPDGSLPAQGRAKQRNPIGG